MTDIATLAGLALGYFLTFGRPGSSKGEKIIGVLIVLAILWWLVP